MKCKPKFAAKAVYSLVELEIYYILVLAHVRAKLTLIMSANVSVLSHLGILSCSFSHTFKIKHCLSLVENKIELFANVQNASHLTVYILQPCFDISVNQ